MKYCRFVATKESHAHPAYKRKLVEMDATDYTNIFGRARWPGAPQRVLQTPFYDDWKSLPANENESNQPVIGRSTINGLVSSPCVFSTCRMKKLRIFCCCALLLNHIFFLLGTGHRYTSLCRYRAECDNKR